MPAFDAVIVGSGINSMVAGALLARAGWRVCVLERSDRLGGAIRTEETTLPGFRHERYSAWHGEFVASAAYAELGDELRAAGVEYLRGRRPSASVYPDGTAVVLSASRERNEAELDAQAPGDGRAWRASAEALDEVAGLVRDLMQTELASAAGLALAVRAARRLGARRALSSAGELLTSCRDWLEAEFESPATRGLFAPWALHAGVGPDSPASAIMARLIVAGQERGGIAVPRGGGSVLVDALAALIERAGGACHTASHVERIDVRGGRARAVELSAGRKVAARRAVICSVTPQQLYGELLADAPLDPHHLDEARRFRFGRAGMQIHMALSQRPAWVDPRLAEVAVVHVTGGLDAVSRAVSEAERGLLPAEPTITCGQPVAVDPARAPEGSWILWIQLLELPPRPRGDAAGILDTGEGRWDDALRERYADRIQARLERHITNLDSALLSRVVLSPADIAAANINLVGGDFYAGARSLDQSLVWRPRPSLRGHQTPVAGLYHIGASTHPGPGLGAGSGTLLARRLLRRRLGARSSHA